MKVYHPQRKKYNKSLKKKACSFCDPLVIKKQKCQAFDFVHWLVIVNQYPYLDGNVMIVPLRHVVTTEGLTSVEWQEFPQVLKDVQKKLGKIFSTTSFNIALNVGRDSGRSVPHIHWQIIPRCKKNYTAVGLFAKIQIITVSPAQLKSFLSK